MMCPHCGNEVYQPITALNLVPNVNGCAQPSTFQVIPNNPTVAVPSLYVQGARDNTLCSAAYSPPVTPVMVRG